MTLPPILASPFPESGVWRRVFQLFYGSLAVVFLVLGRIEFAVAYLLIAAVFCLQSLAIDWFTPITVSMHSFGIYFLAVMAFQKDLLASTLHYVVLTLALFVMIYVVTPQLRFSRTFGRTANASMRTDLLSRALIMQALGFCAFAISVRLAGFTNPFDILANPLQYRFYMMTGGMTYLTILINILIDTPVLVVAVAYFKNKIGPVWFAAFCMTGLIYAVVSGARSNVVTLIIQVLILRHILKCRVSIALFCTSILVFLPFLAIMGAYRDAKALDPDITLSDVMQTLNGNVMAALVVKRFDAASGFNHLMAKQAEIEASFGASYIEIPLQVIPRSMWPAKPRMPNPTMTRMLGWDDGMSDVAFDFGIFGETLINFQWMGCVAGAILLTGVLGWLQAMCERALLRKSVMDVLICALFWFIPFVVIVSGLVEATVTAASVLVYLLTIRFVFLKKERHRGKPGLDRCKGLEGFDPNAKLLHA